MIPNPSAAERTTVPKTRYDSPMSVLPVPDPSVLTTQQILREVSILDDKLTEKVVQRHHEDDANGRLMDARFRAIEKTVDSHVEWSKGIPAVVVDQVGHLRGLVYEKFAGVDLRFAERDVRTEQASQSSAQALAAALQAAKELVGAQGEASAAAAVKSETAFTKQFEQIVATITTLTDAIDKRIT